MGCWSVYEDSRPRQLRGGGQYRPGRESGATGGNVTGLSLQRPTWLASSSNSPPVGDLGQCRQSHWRAGDARGSRQLPARSASRSRSRNPASRGHRACVRHAQEPRGSTLCRAPSAFDHEPDLHQQLGRHRATADDVRILGNTSRRAV